MDPRRAAFVWVPETKRSGSGYAIRCEHGDFVITAAHVVTGSRRCQIRLRDHGAMCNATVVWSEFTTTDIAVLRLDAALDLELGDEPTWASCGDADLTCSAIGYPHLQHRQGKVDTEQFEGQLRIHSGALRGLLNIVHDGSARPNDDWKGMSGAAVFARGFLIGVVTQADNDRLLARPLAPLLDRADFVTVFGASLVERLRPHPLWPNADQGALDCLVDWTPLPHPTTQRPGQLLRAGYEVVPFADDLRANELEQLRLFSEGSGPGILIVTGPGGSGKTRLLLEWCKRVRSQGWIAGFLDPQIQELRPAASGVASRLLVIDYAETQTERIVGLAHAMLRARERPTTRLVLLARQRGPWIDRLRDDDRVAELVNARAGVELALLRETQMRETFASAYRAFSGDNPPSEVQVLGNHDGRPLLAHMRALLAIIDGPDAALDREQVLRRILTHERIFWAARLELEFGRRPSLTQLRAADRAAAALVLTGGVDEPSQLTRLFEQSCNQPSPTELEALAACFTDLYGRGRRVVGLEPDLLGEQLVLETLATDEEVRGPEALAAWLQLPFVSGIPGAVDRALTVMTRLTTERENIRAKTWLIAMLLDREIGLLSEASPAILAAAILAADDLGVARRLEHALPMFTVRLVEVAWATVSVIVNAHRRDADDDGGRSRLGTTLGELGVRAAQLGRFEEGLAVSQEAVQIFRQLADSNPGEFLPELAKSLNNLGNRYGELGNHDQALEATQTAVKLLRGSSERSPAHIRVFAPSLANLGLRLLAMERREQALAALDEAIIVFHEQLEAGRFEVLPDLAKALNNRGLMLSRLGCFEDAASVTQQSVDLLRPLVESSPDAFLPLLWLSLNTLSVIQANLGEHECALTTTQEAVEIAERLAEARPEVFKVELARSLDNLGLRLGQLGRCSDARQANRRAVVMFRELAEARPGLFLPELGRVLDNLSRHLVAEGKADEAVDAVHEAVDIRRQLAARVPEIHEAEFARGLAHLGDRLAAVGRFDEALDATQQAVDVFRRLVERSPGAFTSALANNLDNLGNRLNDLDRHADAVEAARESIQLHRLLAAIQPRAHRAELADSLANLGNHFSELSGNEESLEEALLATSEAVEIYRALVVDSPTAYSPQLATGLSNLGLRLSARGRHQEALRTSLEALELRRPLAEANPDVDGASLVACLGARACVLLAAGQVQDAAHGFAEGLRVVGHLWMRSEANLVRLTLRLVHDYRQACHDADIEMAEDLVPLVAFVDRLKDRTD